MVGILSIVNDEFFFDASNSLLSIPLVREWRDAHDPHVDATGEMYFLDLHSHDQPITQECHSFVFDALTSFSQSVKQCLPDLDALLPNFGWVGKDLIQTTLEKTSQHYKADQQIPMQKHFRSRFPAANVRWLLEWYSMDTFFSDIPATDDGIPGHSGCTMVQIYGGLDSELLSGHPMSSESSLPDMLRDFIHEYGTMEGLKSDNAKSETSFAMKDIFCMYTIKDQQSEPTINIKIPSSDGFKT